MRRGEFYRRGPSARLVHAPRGRVPVAKARLRLSRFFRFETTHYTKIARIPSQRAASQSRTAKLGYEAALEGRGNGRHASPVVDGIPVSDGKRTQNFEAVLSEDSCHRAAIVEINVLNVDDRTALAEQAVSPRAVSYTHLTLPTIYSV